jgi:dihydrofolate synthase / folylpolyglutamate synthase
MFQRVGASAFRKDLTNTLRICKALGNPQHKFASVHVAGTNGKGSVTHMIAAVLQKAGLRTGIYCSPHLKDFTERIKVNGEPVGEAFVVDFTERMKQLIESYGPSFFEITVAMAFDYFAHEQVDIAVIETGMGGRLDSTNVLRPMISVITNIGMDHQQFLGDTLAEIAFEKAGIIKPGIPAIIGESHPETAPVFRDVAFSRQAPLRFADQDIRAEITSSSLMESSFKLIGRKPFGLNKVKIDNGAAYQARNLVTTLASLDELAGLGWNIPPEAVKGGLENFQKLTAFRGRWMVLRENGPTIIADCAHNPDGMALSMQQIAALPHRRLHMVVGTVHDKKLKPYLDTMPAEALYYWCAPDIPRALDAEGLAKAAETQGRHGKAYTSVAKAFDAAKQAADPDDLIYVGGSIFVVAEVA